MLFDRARLRHRPHLREAAFLHVRLAEEIVERLAFVARAFDRGLAVGALTPEIRAVWEAAPVRWTFAGPEGADVAADILMPFSRRFPLAVSINELHVAEDPVTALGEMRGTLVPDALFLGAAASSGTLEELADALLAAEADLTGNAAMRVAPFADVRRWGDGLARAGFAMPVADEVRLTVRYASLRALLDDIGRMGLRGILAERRPAPRRLFERAEEIYRDRAGDPDGRLRATFAFAFLSGWAPDAGQRPAARRGSGQIRLEDALKAIDGEGDSEPTSPPA